MGTASLPTARLRLEGPLRLESTPWPSAPTPQGLTDTETFHTALPTVRSSWLGPGQGTRLTLGSCVQNEALA